jgi:hypothetical protein
MRSTRRTRVAFLALGLYLGQLLLAPVLHQAAHATEFLHSSGCETVLTGETEVHAPCALPCADPDHHHETAGDADHAIGCGICSGLNAPSRVEAAPSICVDLHAAHFEQPFVRARYADPGLSAASQRGPPLTL